MSCNNKTCNQKHENSYHEENIEKKEKTFYILAVIVFAISFIPMFSNTIKMALYIFCILLAGYELLWEGIKNIFKLNFEEDTLMTIAIVAACILGEFMEGCLVVLLFKLGEFIEEIAVAKSNQNIESIAKMQAKNANLIAKDGKLIVCEVEKVNIGDIILIKPGEMVPLDCIIISGSSELDTSNITGESTPTAVVQGQELLSGVMNLTGSLECKVTKDFKHSTASQMIDLVYEATNNKGKTEKFITKFSKIYTPVVILLALAMAVVPWILGADIKQWLMRALVFLVASCPCSIVISIPLAFFSCIGAVSKKGMIIKGTKHIENFAKAKTVCFDKTGTITTGKMEIQELKILVDRQKEEVLNLMNCLENNSNHPIASAIKQEIKDTNTTIQKVEHYEEIAGYGIYGEIEGKKVLLGNEKLLKRYQVSMQENLPKDAILFAVDGKIEAYLTLTEKVRNGLEDFEEKLKKVGIKQAVILTGDEEEKAKKIAAKVGIKQYDSSLLPKEKLEKVQKLKQKQKVIFIGDGINDSPVLAAADFSIAMGEGTELASNTADSILISNNLSILPKVIKIVKRTMGIVYFNLGFSLALKLIVLILGILGIAPIWLAVFADVGVTCITVVNSIRIYATR